LPFLFGQALLTRALEQPVGFGAKEDQGVITETVDLHPRLLDPHTGQVLWEGPGLTYLTSREGWLSWVPTGAETDGCARPLNFTSAPEPAPCEPPSLRHAQPTHVLTDTTPPQTIRVLHSPHNRCRDAVPGQIDIIPFEEYVARVLPAEMPPGWPMEALKAQAIAIRTYAWYQILQARPDYDVTDWTDYQVMCDVRYARTDTAVQATRGQAVFFKHAPILAMYSADNGHPTRGVDWLPYLTPVPDPVRLTATRLGHGYGLSQRGAYLWALRGWNAYQILAHYYPHTTLFLPQDAGEPAGSLLPPELEDMTLGRAYPLRLFAAFPRALQALTVTAHTAEGASLTVLTRTAPISTWLGVWAPPSTFSSPHPITLTVQVADATGQRWTLGEAHVWRDLRPPGMTLTWPMHTVNPTFPITVVAHTPPERPPRFGVGDDWRWEESAFYHRNRGAVVNDPAAWDGKALALPPGAIAYGPYTSILPAGRAYRAWFRLSTQAISRTEEVVFLDVVDNNGQTLRGLRSLRGIEFPGPGEYREYPVDFYLPPGPDGPDSHISYTVEFRTHALAAGVRLDRVLVTSYPWEKQENPTHWRLPVRDGVHHLVAKQTTRTGLVGPDVPLTVTLHVPHPAMTFTTYVPDDWITARRTVTWSVTTAVAPIREDEFFYRVRRAGEPWSRWYAMTARALSPRTGVLQVDTGTWPDGDAVFVEVFGRDAFFYSEKATFGPYRVDQNPPELTLTFSSQPNERGWYTAPLTAQVTGQDMGIGVERITAYVATSAGTRDVYRTITLRPQPMLSLGFPLQVEGHYTITVTGRDALTHTREFSTHLALDTTPPRARVYPPARVRTTWFKVRWQGWDLHRIVGYDVEVEVNGQGWRRWLWNTSRTWAIYSARPGQVIRLRVRARDEAGWVGPWSDPIAISVPYVAYLAHLGDW